jgi:adenylosuccinate lyase
MADIHPLLALSPLDGRYAGRTRDLAEAMGEMGLFRARAEYQWELLLALTEHPRIPFEVVGGNARDTIIRPLFDLTIEDGETIKQIETKGTEQHKATYHDVQALVLHLRDKLTRHGLGDIAPWVHFAGTSEDCNNIAYGLMLREGIGMIVDELHNNIMRQLTSWIDVYADLPMLARTHGQAASPTTFGKMIRVYHSRLTRQVRQLDEFKLLVKYNGATGNYHGHVAAFPEVDWIKFTEDFIARFNEKKPFLPFEVNLFTTQIEPHDNYAELFSILRHTNTILIDLCQNLWRLISDDWIAQRVEGVGSSAMPHKVNPIDIENAEGNLMVANTLLEMFERTLPISRLERHLSDSTVIRNFGSALGYMLVAYSSIQKGLGKYTVNEQKIAGALDAHPEVIAEAIQNILRAHGEVKAHERLQKLTQGKDVSLEAIQNFIATLDVPKDVKSHLLAITPRTYTGLAAQLAKRP